MDLKLDSDAGSIHYRTEGRGTPVVLLHSLGCDASMWDAQSEALKSQFMVLRYDMRGHGGSRGEPRFRVEDLASDLLRLLDHCGIGRAAVVGLSLGGIVAQAFASRSPARVQKLVLADTTCAYPEGARALWLDRIHTVRESGISPVVVPTLERWFTEQFRRDHPRSVARVADILRGTDAEGYADSCSALMHADMRPNLASIHTPTLILVGDQDQATPPAMALDLHERIVGSRLIKIQGAAHLSNIERPNEFNRALIDFLLEDGEA